METIVLHVYYTCKPGRAAAFVQTVKAAGLQEAIRAEEGCLRYDYHLSCEAPDTVVLIEQWRDAAALDRHLAQPHMEDLRRLKGEYALDTKLERYE
jgi:quinol monooxygenase YgiN